MKKFLTVLGGIILGVAAIAGTVYAVLYFIKKDEKCDDCCYIDDDDCCCEDDDCCCEDDCCCDSDEAEEDSCCEDGCCCCEGNDQE